MSFTQSQIDALEARIATSVAALRHGDTSVTERSIDDMKKTLAMMKREVNASSHPRRTLATFRGSAG